MKKIHNLIFAVCILFASHITGQNANFSAVLPALFPTNASGQIHGISRISQMKFHPTNLNKMYAVSARGGLFISSDGGNNWTVTPGTDFMSTARFASVCIDYTNDQTIYLGGGDANYYSSGSGVYKSTNGGTTFTQTTLNNRIILEMIMDPSNNNVIVAATNSGIYKTTNAGSTWTLKTGAIAFYDMKQKQNSGSRVLFAATQSGLYRSLDFGDTWTAITNGIYIPSAAANGGGCRLGVTPADTNIVFLAMNDKGGSIFKSTDGGANFVNIKDNLSPYLTGYTNNTAEPGQGNYNLGFGVDRNNPNTIYFVAHNVWKSTDGGVTWVQLTVWYQKVHTDMHEIFTSPYDNNKLYNMNDGGVWLSTDGGNNWTPKSDGIYGYEIYHGNCSPTRKDMISIGTQDNGELYANSAGWFTNRGGDWTPKCAFDYRPNSSMVYYYGNDKRRLVNGSDATYGLPVTSLEDIAFNRNNINLAFAGNLDIYRSTNLQNATPTWTKISTFNKGIKAVHSSLADINKLYVITNDGFIYICNDALAASPTFTPVALPNTTNTAASITTITSTSNTIYITCNTKAYRSTNNGFTWTDVTFNLPSVNHVRVLSDEYFSNNELVFVASNNAVYYKTASANTWSIYNTNLPTRTSIVDMSIFNDGTSNTSLRITTYGRGMWETPISNLRTATANFIADNTSPCVGGAVNFSDLSVGNVVSRLWTFPGGTPSTSTATSPSVVYNTAGNYNVSLQVSDGTNSNTMTKTAYININGSNLPLTEGFEGTQDPPEGWKNKDNGTVGFAWLKTTTASGFGGSVNAMMFDNWSWNGVGQRDELQVKKITLSALTTANMTFDVAYQAYNSSFDSLIVRVSSDCGNTYTRLYAKGGANLSTAGAGSSEFIPTAVQWRTENINLNAFIGQNIIVEFQNYNAFGNNIYIDNVNINGTASIVSIAGANGAISPNGATSVTLGSNQNYTISPGSCYTIQNVLVDGISQGAISNYTFNNVNTSHTINATFTPITYTINASAGTNGSITTPGNSTVNCGTNQSYTFTPNSCYQIANVIVDGVAQGALSSYSFNNVTANHTISVSFSQITYSINATAGANGNISPFGINNVNCGANQFYTITPNPNYSIQNVLVDGISQGNISSYTFNNIGANHTINASFTLNCTPVNWYLDADADGYSIGSSIVSCNSPGVGYISTAPLGTDCNDADFAVHSLPAASVITAGGATSFCAGSSVTLSGNNASGLWSNGQTSATITVQNTGTYFVTNTNSCGAVQSNNIEITVNNLPVVTITTNGSTTLCPGGTIILTSSQVTGNVWNTGATSSSITVNTAGTYSVIFTNANNCSATNSVVISAASNCIPLTQLRSADCGKQNLALNAAILCNAVAGATNYDFEFTNLTTSVVAVKTTSANSVGLGSVTPAIQFGTQYNVRVRAKVGGVYGNYGTVCLIGTVCNPSICGVPATQLRTGDCGKLNLSPLTGQVIADPVAAASQYEFEFRNISTNTLYATKLQTSNVILLNSVSPAMQWNTQYNVKVRAYIAGVAGTYGNNCVIGFIPDPSVVGVPNTQLTTSYCGKTNLALTGSITCTAVTGAGTYEWEFKNQANTTVVATKTTTSTGLNLSTVTGLQWNTQYNVRVRAYIGAVGGNYNVSCLIGLIPDPAINGVPATKIRTADCGKLNFGLGGFAVADAVSGAAEYEFEIRDVNTNAFIANKLQASNVLTFSTVPAFTWGNQYKIAVRARISSTWGTLGTTCTIGFICNPNLCGVPNTALRTGDCGKLNFNLSTGYAVANTVAGATLYEFEITDITTSTIVTVKSSTTVNLYFNTIVPALSSTKQYSIRVRATISGVVGTYGSACTIGFVSGSREEEQSILEDISNENTFNLMVYPNPFNTQSNLLIQSNSNDKVQVQIVDMMGNLVWDQQVITNENVAIGNEFAKGTYLIRVHHENGTEQMERIIKVE